MPVTLTGPRLDVGATDKAVDNAGPLPGEVITYTIVVHNDGELDAQATVTDVLPELYVDYTGNGRASSGFLHDAGTPITWTGAVTAGGRITITLPVTVTTLEGVSFDNVARIADGTGDVFTRTRTVTVRSPDLNHGETAKVALPDAVAQNGSVDFVIAVVNHGDGPAPSARVTDTLPLGVVYAGGASASLPGLDDSGAPTIVWAGGLDAGGGPDDRVVITIPVQITAALGTDVVNRADVDDGLGNIFQREGTVHVYTRPDLTASDKAVWPQVAAPGDTLIYTLTVRNSGETPASFVVTDTLDPDTTYVNGSANPTPASVDGGTIVWSGTVGAAGEEVLTFRATLEPTTRPAVTNTARFDDGLGNVHTAVAVTALSRPELGAAKLVEPGDTVNWNQRITYTIVLTNEGNTPLEFTLADPIPGHTIYAGGLGVDPVDFPSLPIYHPTTDTVTFAGELPPAGWVRVSFGVFVAADAPDGSTITNTVTLDVLNDGAPAFTREAGVVVRGHWLFLPLVMRN